MIVYDIYNKASRALEALYEKCLEIGEGIE